MSRHGSRTRWRSSIRTSGPRQPGSRTSRGLRRRRSHRRSRAWLSARPRSACRSSSRARSRSSTTSRSTSRSATSGHPKSSSVGSAGRPSGPWHRARTEMAGELRIYSGRNRPDLTPVYLLFERLTGIKTTVEKVYHHDVEQRIVAERVEMTTVAQFAALRVVKGDAYAARLIDALLANGMRIYGSNLRTREALARERKAVAIANFSNIHVFYMEGNPVGEAWLDQAG